MMRWKPWVAGVGLCVVASPVLALPVMLDFEGIANGAQILSYYSGGLGSNPASDPATGTDFGVTFTSGLFTGATPADIARSTAWSNLNSPPELFSFIANVERVAPGSHPLSNPPNLSVMSSGGTIAGSPSYAELTSSAGIDLSTLSFWYSSTQFGKVEAFDANESSLGFASITLQSRGEYFDEAEQKQKTVCGNAGEPTFCNWTQVLWNGSGTATSLRFYNDALTGTETLYDNISYSTVSEAPEPSTYALMALGLAAVALGSRRRRERIASA
jgi:PEP-CTERM motif